MADAYCTYMPQFVLAPHMDGGGIERWKDRNYRSVYRRILEGDPDAYDPFEADYRAVANMNELGSACTFFRMFQGWLATSASGERRKGLAESCMIICPALFAVIQIFPQAPGRAHSAYSLSSRTPLPTSCCVRSCPTSPRTSFPAPYRERRFTSRPSGTPSSTESSSRCRRSSPATPCGGIPTW